MPPKSRAHHSAEQCILVLQGGGALGAYQGGVYETLEGAGLAPTWLAGISIGAINAALIAGNAPERRVERLREFWDGVSTLPFGIEAPQLPAPLASIGRTRDVLNETNASIAMLFGVAGFFQPRVPPAPFQPPGTLAAISYYDTEPLKRTLERMVDFDRINSGAVRLSVGAVNVRTGNFLYFDSRERRIDVRHVMASGALPPGFPPIEIDGEFYWDGGLVSNTPLQHVLDQAGRERRLVFQVDLFSARGDMPTTIADVAEREKDIRFSSRTRTVTDIFRQMHDVRHNVNTLLEQLPPEIRNTPVCDFLYAFGCVTTMDIVQLVYRPDDPQGLSKDYEFSRSTMRERWNEGRSDALVTLEASPWLTPMPPEVGARTFDVPLDLKRRAKAPSKSGVKTSGRAGAAK